MKFQSTGKWTKADAARNTRVAVAATINDLRMACGAPTDKAALAEKVEAHKWPRGQKVIARNVLSRAVAEDATADAIKIDRRAHFARLSDWAKKLPDAAKFATARRGGYVAVLNGVLIGRFHRAAEAITSGQPYIESPKRPLRDIALLRENSAGH